ncbi:hypothetical protein [Falsiroseomonas oryzae]|uniref:hypothetical protein n=1 Tax=Falsiroseomonas oryzae TaxID=2766473 RepID=UPI0022EB3109|nr:hypothetical protein [Roseomonas sp. MO-31]
MGGMGSGRHGRRVTVEGCRSLVLDVNAIMRAVHAAPGWRPIAPDDAVKVGPIRWFWTRRGEAEPWAEVCITLDLRAERGHARLQFDVHHWTRRTGPQDQRVHLLTTPCRFGGVRWWWRCPATGRRCAKLYLPNGGTLFLSRGPGAYRLAYASQNGSALDRSHARLARLHRKLGGIYDGPDCPLPGRPKWMRRRTYERLWTEWKAQLERHDEVWMDGAARLLSRA